MDVAVTNNNPSYNEATLALSAIYYCPLKVTPPKPLGSKPCMCRLLMPVLVSASGVGYTAVMFAAEEGHEPCVTTLVEGKADLDLQGKRGEPLISGSSHGLASITLPHNPLIGPYDPPYQLSISIGPHTTNIPKDVINANKPWKYPL